VILILPNLICGYGFQILVICLRLESFCFLSGEALVVGLAKLLCICVSISMAQSSIVLSSPLHFGYVARIIVVQAGNVKNFSTMPCKYVAEPI